MVRFQKLFSLIVLLSIMGVLYVLENYKISLPLSSQYLDFRDILSDGLNLPLQFIRVFDSAYQQLLPNPSGTVYIGYLILGLFLCTILYTMESYFSHTKSSSLTSTGDRRSAPKSLVSFLFPNGFLNNPNIRIDLFLFATKLWWSTKALTISILSLSAFSTYTTDFLGKYFTSPNLEATTFVCIIYSIVSLLVLDLAFYSVHYFQHFTKLGWSLHETHHSQTELNVFSDDRESPLTYLVIKIFPSGFVGILLSLFLFFFPNATQIVYAKFIFAYILWTPTKIFRHSHVLIRYPKVIEWLIQSPAYHIVHHSKLPQHLDKNLGNFTTVWDRIFGTLHVPLPDERYHFGVLDDEVEEKHKSLYGIYIWQTIRIIKQFYHSTVYTIQLIFKKLRTTDADKRV